MHEYVNGSKRLFRANKMAPFFFNSAHTVGAIKKFQFHIVLRPSPVKYYDPITGANRNYGSPIYSVITWFIRVSNARARGSLHGYI